VNIDVGRKDFLRLNVQFGVFARGETNVNNRKKKGTITVTKFIGDNLAEARILESDLRDPILQGDVIFTPTWTPGIQETFVLAGDFDVTGDKKPDNELLETLVEMNGGKIEKDVDIGTRYLLLGDAPPKTDKEDAFREYEKKRTRARELSIKVMGLQEFLEYTGARDTWRQLVNQDVRSDEDTNRLLKPGAKREAAKGARSLEPEGGPRRLGPGAKSPEPGTGNEENRKFKMRRANP
jgi:hypothetical protein